MKRILKPTSIQGRLGAIVFSILLLFFISVGLTFWGLENQNQDAHTINLAGRQRMLVQQISNVMLSNDPIRADSDTNDLVKAVTTYEQTLTTLIHGGTIMDYSGQVLTLKPPADPLIKAELAALMDYWSEFRPIIDRVLNGGSITVESLDAVVIENHTQILTNQADRVATAYERNSTQKLSRLINLQLAFLVFGLFLLGFGWWSSYHTIVLPLRNLEISADRIGEGDLSTPIEVSGPDETRVLAEAMDTMRRNLAHSLLELENWANQLENRVKQRTRELEALSDVGLEISSHLDLGEVLQSVTEKAQMLLGADIASLCLLDHGGSVLQLQAIQGPAGSIQQQTSPVLADGVGIILNTMGAQNYSHDHCANFCAILRPEYRQSHLAAPLKSRGRVIGALCAGSKNANAFSVEASTILTQLANAAAGALENSRLYEQAEHAATLEERQRIASDMHDGLLQTLSFLQWMVRQAKEQIETGELSQAIISLSQIERANRQADNDIRQVMASMQLESPMHTTLQKQLEDLARSTAESKVPILLKDHALLPIVLNRQISEQVLRVVREAVMNAQRYSQAHQINIHLESCDGQLIVEVEDDGVGFEPMASQEDGRPHFGMKIMRARAARLDGKLEIVTKPGNGTRIRLTWPHPIHEQIAVGSEP